LLYLADVLSSAAAAAAGEVVFVLVGAAFQAVSMLSEATRLTLVQVNLHPTIRLAVRLDVYCPDAQLPVFLK
jgi:hypothetical protein